MFTRLSLADLVDLCRVLRHQLSAGISLQRVLQQQSQRGRRSYRALCGRLHDAIRKGSSFSAALEQEKNAFPPLFLAMAKLGETTGHLAEIFGELERYFELELQLKRQFRSQIFFPAVQFFFAVAIVAAVIFIVGMFSPTMLTIFGLSGGAGALAFLGAVFGTLFTVWSIYFVLSRSLRRTAFAHRFLFYVPLLGSCLYSLAMSRFTLALQLTLDSGLPITKGLALSLEATGNMHFASRAGGIVQSLKGGNTLYESLKASQLFDYEFLEMVANSEEVGSVPEMMRRLTNQYQEETSRNMKMLTRGAGAAIAVCVAVFIIFAIVRLFNVYLNALQLKF